LIVVTLIALAVPLALSLKQIAWEAVASRQAREAFTSYFGPNARLSQLDIDYDTEPVGISATVFSPQYRARSEAEMTMRLSRLLDRPVRVGIDQVRTENGEAEAQEIAAAKGATGERSATRMAERLALIAGVTPDAVLIDRGSKRAHVRAAALPGADLGTYRVLEARVSSAEAGWTIVLVPPAAPLPAVEFDGSEPTADGLNAIGTAAWAGQRLRLTIGVSSSSHERAELVRVALAEAGVQAEIVDGGGGGAVRLQWLTPGAPDA
jgi:hypothetical protein